MFSSASLGPEAEPLVVYGRPLSRVDVCIAFDWDDTFSEVPRGAALARRTRGSACRCRGKPRSGGWAQECCVQVPGDPERQQTRGCVGVEGAGVAVAAHQPSASEGAAGRACSP